MDLHTFLVLGHVIGTAMGLGGSIVAEAQIRKAIEDGNIENDERALMHANYFLIRVGLALVIVSGLALMWWFLLQGNDWVLKSQKLWVKDIMVVAIIINAVAISKRFVPLWLGSAISLGSWLWATILGIWRTPYSFWPLMAGYVILVALVAVLLYFYGKFSSRA
ncbi:MAG: hypothetical protein AAB355_00525 [Patescibacteria group bacterium]